MAAPGRNSTPCNGLRKSDTRLFFRSSGSTFWTAKSPSSWNWRRTAFTTCCRNAGKQGFLASSAISSCYLSDAADGLDFLSETHNLTHLDVKPRNLFLVGDHVKVADFGLAKHLERSSSSGIMAGISPQYAAPETFTSRITKFSDQYSLAIVYHELLTGRRPFSGKTIRELALQHMNVEPDLSGLPERDRRIVARALAKDPYKRFPNCRAFVEAFGPRGGSMPTSGCQFRQHRPLSSPPNSLPGTTTRRPKCCSWIFESAPKTLAVAAAELSASPPR